MANGGTSGVIGGSASSASGSGMVGAAGGAVSIPLGGNSVGGNSVGGSLGTGQAGGATAGDTAFSGSSSAGTAGQATAGACTLASALVGAPIYDAEQLNAMGNDYVQMTSSGFFLYYDEAHVGTISPPKATPGLGVVSGNGGQVFRSAGTGLAADFWGAGVGLWVTPCLDASTITGVSFWLKSDRPVKLEVSSPATTPVSGGGSCAAGCVANAIATPLAPSASGTLVKVPFSSFRGGSAPFDLKHLTGFVFEIDAPGGSAWSYDLQIDDLGVY